MQGRSIWPGIIALPADLAKRRRKKDAGAGVGVCGFVMNKVCEEREEQVKGDYGLFAFCCRLVDSVSCLWQS